MTSECTEYGARIAGAFVGDLTREQQEALEHHLESCAPCRAEHERLAQTLLRLQAVDDEPVPRHFFIDPPERIGNPWQLFRQMIPRWQAATAGAAAVFLLAVILAAAGFHVRADNGSWEAGFAFGKAVAPVDTEALKAEILGAFDQRQREAATAIIRQLRAEIAASSSAMSQEQKVEFSRALDRVDAIVSGRISLAASDIRGETRRSLVEMYRTLVLQQDQGLVAVNARIDGMAGRMDEKARQTDSILETLLDLTELRIRQSGEQK